MPDSEGFIPHASRLTSQNSGENQVDRTPFYYTNYYTICPEIYADLWRFA
ncbi:hypothetical protein [Coprococcus catus]|nr:hypothetical protein [Coprococcus catus]